MVMQEETLNDWTAIPLAVASVLGLYLTAVILSRSARSWWARRNRSTSSSTSSAHHTGRWAAKISSTLQKPRAHTRGGTHDYNH